MKPEEKAVSLELATEMLETLHERGMKEGFSPGVAIAALLSTAVTIQVISAVPGCSTSQAIEKIIQALECMGDVPVPSEMVKP